MTSVYCGASKPPGNQKKGTPLQCLEKGQIRLYGRELAPQKVLNMIDGVIPRNPSLETMLRDADYTKSRYEKIRRDYEELKKKHDSPISAEKRAKYAERMLAIKKERAKIRRENEVKKAAYYALKKELEDEEKEMEELRKREAREAKKRRKHEEEEAARDRKSRRKINRA